MQKSPHAFFLNQLNANLQNTYKARREQRDLKKQKRITSFDTIAESHNKN